MKKIFTSILLLFLSITLFSQTYHSGNISTNETWSFVDNPHYITGTVSVLDGVTLTIEPGCVIKFSGNYVFNVFGTLNANGTPANHITITSDDVSPSNGDWQYIYFHFSDGVNLLNYCDINYGGFYYGNVFTSSTDDITISNCNIGNSATNGIYAIGNSSPKINNSSIFDNDEFGIYTANANCDVDLNGVNLTNNLGPAMRLTAAAVGLTDGISMSGNAPDEIQVIGDNIVADALWDDIYPYHILGNMTVIDATTLTLAPGITWKFGGNYTFNIYGTLNASGTAADRITITSNQLSPANGDWQYIYFYYADGVNLLNYCDIYYGGSSYGNVFTNSTVDITISNCNIGNSATNGLYSIGSSSPKINNSSIFSNNEFGIFTANSNCDIDINTIDLTNNVGPAMRLTAAAVGLTDGITMTGNGLDEIQVIGDNIEANALWDDVYPYHILGNMTIIDGITLTLAPGIFWKFGGNYNLTIYGTLLADGTAGNHITITSNQNSPSNGDWQYIYFNNPDGVNLLNYCDILYGGSTYGNILMDAVGSDFTISNSNIGYSNSSGIYLNGTSSPAVNSCTISNNNNHGVFANSNCDPGITNCTIESNGSFGLFTNQASSDIDITGGNVTNNSGPAIRLSAVAVGLLDGMSMSGNAPDEIQVIADNIAADAVWDDTYPYHILGNMSISDGTTLTLAPGATWKFGGNYTFEIYGTLIADGTPGDHITFTSNQGSPANGDWQYFYFYYPDGVNLLDYCDIYYGGSSLGNIYTVGPGDITFSNCEIGHSATHGLHAAGSSTPNLIDCTVSSNGSFGIFTSDANSDIDISGGSVINNSGPAIRLSAAAVGLLDGMSMSGNAPDEIQVISDNITSSALWDDLYPYQTLGNMSIGDGTTLTLAPGVTWKFGGNYTFEIYGTLIADGTPGDHITFTSIQGSPANGDWQYFYFYYPDGVNLLDYCDIYYGGSSLGNIYTVGPGDITFSNCEIGHSATHGLHAAGSSTPNLIDCTFSSNGSFGIFTSDANSDIDISGGSVINNSGPAIRLSAAAVGLLGGMSMSGNAPDEIQVIGDNIAVDAVWDDTYPYHTLGNMSISDGITLTLAPGVTWKFGGIYTFEIYGTLIANGTPWDHITFTSIQGSPAKGDWQYLYFYYPDGENLLNYCDIYYGGYNYASILTAGPGDITISNCDISNSSNDGIQLGSGLSPIIYNCLLSNNDNDGISIGNNCFPQLTNNQIINNQGNGISNNGSGNPSFGNNITHWNDIYGNTGYNFYNNSVNDVTALFIYWGSTDSTQIATTIYDYYDDAGKGIVYFNPWINAAHDSIYPDSFFYLSLKVFLEGPFNGTNMNTYLSGSGKFPLSQPYNVSPWNYPGTESVFSIPNNAVDWVLVELRDAATASNAASATIIDRFSGLLLDNGRIVAIDGNSNVLLTDTINNDLFIVVWQRNHLGIMSASPLVPSGGVYSYDFTAPIGQAHNSGQKGIGGGVFGMIAGDANADDIINDLDKTLWSGQTGTDGYLQSELNLDNQVDNQDKNDYWLPNNGNESQVPE